MGRPTHKNRQSWPDAPQGEGGDAERVLRGEVPRGVGEGAVDRRADHVGAGGWRVPSDEPEPVVEGVVPPAFVRVVPVGAPDGRELPEERHDALRMVPGVAPGLPGLVVLRGRGARREQLCHEVAAEPVHVVEERLLEPRRAGDAVALDGLRGGVDERVDPRGAPQDELREFF